MTVRYDSATGPSGGPTPGAVALRDHWRKATGMKDMGIYNPRPIRGGSGWSVHAEGRAVDLAANAYLTAERETADRYCQFLVDCSVQIQCQYLIWNRRSWKSGRGWRVYSGSSPHTDHIHAELNRDGARDVTYAQLTALWSDWTGDHQEDPMAADPRGTARICMREYLGRSPATYGELDFHAGQIEMVGLNAYIEWLETQQEAKDWAKKVGAEVRTPDRT